MSEAETTILVFSTDGLKVGRSLSGFIKSDDVKKARKIDTSNLVSVNVVEGGWDVTTHSGSTYRVELGNWDEYHQKWQK